MPSEVGPSSTSGRIPDNDQKKEELPSHGESEGSPMNGEICEKDFPTENVAPQELESGWAPKVVSGSGTCFLALGSREQAQ